MTEFRASDKYKKGRVSTCKPCENMKNKTRRQKRKLENITTLEQYLTIKLSNMRRMDSKHRRVVIFYPTVEDLKNLIVSQNNTCIYTGVELKWHPSADIYHKGSFDRIDNRYGHEVGNLQIVSVSANLLRGKKTHEEFMKEIQKSALDIVSDDEDGYLVN
jgi:hypothetical protein